jgi:chemotaxis methyl-accepting protein methylase
VAGDKKAAQSLLLERLCYDLKKRGLLLILGKKEKPTFKHNFLFPSEIEGSDTND